MFCFIYLISHIEILKNIQNDETRRVKRIIKYKNQNKIFEYEQIILN